MVGKVEPVGSTPGPHLTNFSVYRRVTSTLRLEFPFGNK